MKLKTSILFAASLALATGVQAATIVWTSSGLSGASDVLATTATRQTVFANVAAAGSETTVNGVAFTANTTQSGITLSLGVTPGNEGVATGSLAGVSTIGGSSQYATLLDGNRWSHNTLTFNFSGLTTGYDYTVRVWAADYREAGWNRSESIGGQTVDYRNPDSAAPASSGGGFFTGTFTADGTTQSFTLTGNAGQYGAYAQYNAVQLAVPEPSAALLGGLGMLALLRRRR